MTFSPFKPLGVFSGGNRQSPQASNRCPIGAPGCTGARANCSICAAFYAGPKPSLWSSTAYADIPYAGIRAGEVKAWRFWRVWPDVPELPEMELTWRGIPIIYDPDMPLPSPPRAPRFLLRSISRQCLWKPGKQMQGDVTKHGVFSWNNLDLCISEAGMWLSDCEEPFYVVGTVKLWGEVIEHEYGYRSEFAEVASLDCIAAGQGPGIHSSSVMWKYRKQFSLAAIRKEYGV